MFKIESGKIFINSKGVAFATIGQTVRRFFEIHPVNEREKGWILSSGGIFRRESVCSYKEDHVNLPTNDQEALQEP